MASTTTNIGLTKPAGTDQALISAINGNMDIIDTKMGAVGNTSVQSQITSLSDQIATKTPSQSVTGFRIKKSANVVNVSIDKSVSAQSAGWKIVGQLPSGYIPSVACYFVGFNNSTDESMNFRVTATGDVDVYINAAMDVTVRASVSFIVD